MLLAVEFAKLGELKNKPEMRLSDVGVSYTPSVVTLVCGKGTDKLHFILDDIEQILVVLGGAVITIGGQEVHITCLS